MMPIYKKLLAEATRVSGLNHLTRKLKKGAVALYYHGIVPEIIDPRVQNIHLPFSQFEKQIRYIRKNFEVISVDDLNDCLNNRRNIDRSYVLLTFDDGYKSILQWVAPFLKSYDLPFAVFVSTKHVETGLRFPTYLLRAAIYCSEKSELSVSGLGKSFTLTTPESRATAGWELSRFLKAANSGEVNLVVDDLMNTLSEQRWREINMRFLSDAPMNWEDLREIVRLGGIIGSHGHDHLIFHVGQTPQDIKKQLTISQRLIVENIGRCQYLAFPEGNLGRLSPEVPRMLREIGYKLAFCSQAGEITERSNALLLPRLGPPLDFDHFVFRINNSFIYNRRHRESVRALTGKKAASL